MAVLTEQVEEFGTHKSKSKNLESQKDHQNNTKNFLEGLSPKTHWSHFIPIASAVLKTPKLFAKILNFVKQLQLSRL